MAFRTENNVASQLIASLGGAVSTGAFSLLYARRQVADLDAESGECEFQGGPPSRIAGIASQLSGTRYYGHTTIGTTWAAATTGALESTPGTWTWRALLGLGDTMAFAEAPDDMNKGWAIFPFSPLEQTAFAVASLVLGSNGREAGPHDFAAIRLWDHARDLNVLLAERASGTALYTPGLLLDKLGTGANLSAALAAGTGTMTTGGTVVLNADLPSTIGSVPTPTVLIRPALNAGYSTLSGYLQ